MSFAYNDSGARTQMVDSTGTTTYAYDNANRLTSVTDWNSNSTTYSYDDAGRMTTTTLPSGTGIVSTNTYGFGSTMAIVDSSGNSQKSYTYDVYGEATPSGGLSNEFDFVLPFLVRHSDLSTAVDCWDGDYPYGRVNARILEPLGRLALGDVEGGIASALLHRDRLAIMGADADVIEEQARLAAFIRDYRPVEHPES